MITNNLVRVFLMLAAPLSLSAHVSLVYPVGGEVFAPGTMIKIQWNLEIEHNQKDWDIYFSPDAGETWQEVASDIPVENREYDWSVPDIETVEAQIRIVQDNDVEMDYDAVSDYFIVKKRTTANENINIPLVKSSLTISPNPLNSHPVVRFSLRKKSQIKLEFYDLNGSLNGVTNEEEYLPGDHEISFTSDLPAGLHFITLVIDEIYRRSILVFSR